MVCSTFGGGGVGGKATRVSYGKLENRAPKSHSFLIEHLNSCEFLECYQPFEVSTHYLFCLVTHSSISLHFAHIYGATLLS